MIYSNSLVHTLHQRLMSLVYYNGLLVLFLVYFGLTLPFLCIQIS